MLKKDVHERVNLWWNKKISTQEYATDSGKDTFAPFILKHVDITGQVCSIDHWSKRSFGCKIEPSD